MSAEILTWKSQGCDYKKGVELYEKLGSNKAILQVLKAYENDFTRNKLFDALNEILSNHKKTIEIKKDPKHQRKDHAAEAIRIKEKYKGELYARFVNYHSKMKCAKSKPTRYRLADLIINTEKEINSIWREIDFYHENGKLMQKDEIKPQNVAQLMHRLNLLENYINRAKKAGKTHIANKYADERAQLQQTINNITL